MVGFIKRRWFLVVLIILLVVGLGLFVKGRISNAKGKPFVVKRIDLVDSLSFSGKVDAKEKAALLFQTAGAKVAFVRVKEGDSVKKGQVLAGLDMGDLDAAVNTAWYSYIAADAHAKYIEDTVKDHSKDESFLQKDTRVAAQVDRDKKYDAWLTAIRARDNGILISPIKGIVYKVPDLQPGTIFYLPNSAEFDVVNPESIFFSANADQTDIVKLTVGNEAELTLDSYPDKPLKSVITQIAFSPKTDETGTVYEVKLTLDQSKTGYQYRMGMTGDVNYVVSAKKNVIAVPQRLVKSTDGHKTVMRDIGGRIQGAEVVTGETVEGQTEIISGLSEGDVIYDQAQ